MSSEHWQTLRILIHESDEDLLVGASKLGISVASREDRIAIAHRLFELLSPAPWHLQEDIEGLLVALKDESDREIEDEIAQRMEQPAEVRVRDERLRALLRVKRRLEKIGRLPIRLVSP